MVDVSACSRVEFHISCKNLPDLDTFSKSDPMVLVSLKDPESGEYKELGRTECIKNNLNPSFKKLFGLQYYLEESQELVFKICDVDDHIMRHKLHAHDYDSYCRCGIAEMMSSVGGPCNMQVQSNKKLKKTMKNAAKI